MCPLSTQVEVTAFTQSPACCHITAAPHCLFALLTSFISVTSQQFLNVSLEKLPVPLFLFLKVLEEVSSLIDSDFVLSVNT